MKLQLRRRFYFDAAHTLPHHNGKCSKLHGHTYTLEVSVESMDDENPAKLLVDTADTSGEGLLLDFYYLKKIMAPIISRLDHQNLNQFFEVSSVEYMSMKIFEELKPVFAKHNLRLVSILLAEGRDGEAIASE